MVLCEKWVAALQKDYKFEVKKSHRICSKHFEEEHFIKSTFGNLILKSGAIPTIFDNVERSLFNVNVPNMKDDIDDICIPIIEYSSDSDSSIVVESENIDNENQILSTPQKDSSLKKGKLLRYCGDFCEQDLETPGKRKLFWNAYQKSRQEKNKHIRHLAQKTRRLTSQIVKLNNLVEKLQKQNKTNATCSCMKKY